MKNKIVNMPINYQLIKEDTQYEYLLPEYPFCPCKFNELEQKCKGLKQCLPEDVIEVRVLTMEEVKALPEEIRACGDWWWTSTVSPASNYAYYVFEDGNIGSYGGISNSKGFRPMIIRRKQSILDKVRNDIAYQERGFIKELSDLQKGYMDDM